MQADAPPDVAGFSLNGTEPVVISAAENQALCGGMGVRPAADGQAHPSYYYAVTQIGMGLTVRELCAKCDFEVENGPMMATSGARYLRPLMTETRYWVRGHIESLVRKRSRKHGVMDLLDYRLRLVDEAGETVLEADNVWVLPKPELR